MRERFCGTKTIWPDLKVKHAPIYSAYPSQTLGFRGRDRIRISWKYFIHALKKLGTPFELTEADFTTVSGTKKKQDRSTCFDRPTTQRNNTDAHKLIS